MVYPMRVNYTYHALIAVHTYDITGILPDLIILQCNADMKEAIDKLKVTFQGRTLEIDLQKELSINENIITSQLKESPSSYYILCYLRDKYIRKRNELEREKDAAYSKAWVYYKESNDRWSNEYVSHKANTNKSYASVYERYQKALEKAQMFISICKAYESRMDILRTLNANLRKQ